MSVIQFPKQPPSPIDLVKYCSTPKEWSNEVLKTLINPPPRKDILEIIQERLDDEYWKGLGDDNAYEYRCGLIFAINLITDAQEGKT